ncbi:type I DNA topoisomerase [bacterium]|nr:type I DNA topoisomerase [bacterium]
MASAGSKPSAFKKIAFKSAKGANLVIVESPAKARTLSGYLGKGYVVTASVGHIIDLPPKRLGVNLSADFEPEYVVIDGKEEVVNALKKGAVGSKSVYIATDPDREGEAIAHHIASIMNGGKHTIHRVLFNQITRDAVQQAIKNPGKIDPQKVDAQQARRVLDRLVGYLVSPLLQKIIARGVSAGRVQSVALRLIIEREGEIRAFKAVEYWTIEADLLTSKKEKFEAKLAKIDGEKAEIPNEKTALKILSDLQKQTFKLQDLKTRVTKSSPAPPYTTSTLQQDAARRLGFSNDRTMSTAQALYEGITLAKKEGTVGLITYMRSDSVRVAGEAIDQVRDYIGSAMGKQFLPDHARVYKSKKSAQDAHEAIRPTDVHRDPASVKNYLKPEQYKLYELIWKRFVASQMADAQFEVTTASILAGKYEFRAGGRRVVFTGHLQVLAELMEETPKDASAQLESNLTRELPALKSGDKYKAEQITPHQHFTEPPPRYNAGSLVKILDELGIGRPSTYAQIISVLVKRRYIQVEQRRFHPTDLGEAVCKVLIEQFPDIFNVQFTAQMEEELDSIENDGENWRKVVGDFYEPFAKDLERVKGQRQELKKAHQETVDKPCPSCGGELVVKWGRAGKFIACTNYPECKYTEPLEAEKVPEVPETVCPKCGKPMAPKKSRFGWFLGCTGYPECKTTMSIEDKDAVDCPREGCDGRISKKRSKRGRTFYGCSNYPDCDFVSWYPIILKSCPQCGNGYMEDKQLKSGHIHQCPKCKHKIEVEPVEK